MSSPTYVNVYTVVLSTNYKRVYVTCSPASSLGENVSGVYPSNAHKPNVKKPNHSL